MICHCLNSDDVVLIMAVGLFVVVFVVLIWSARR